MLMNFSEVSDKTLLGKILRVPLKIIPANARVPIIQGPLRGKQWVAGSSNHGCWLGSYETEKQKVFAAAIKPGNTVYDLGANVGFYSLLASVLVGPDGKVFSFEPVPRNLRLLRRHLDMNKARNCSVWEAAVGRSTGMASFELGNGSHEGRLTTESQDTLGVRVEALDGLVASGKLPPPDLIKCDIEGGEYDALIGASSILDDYGPTIFLATHGIQVHQKCCKFLKDLRYCLTSLDEHPLELTRELIAVRREV
jgi:FkbM family methyltransferase